MRLKMAVVTSAFFTIGSFSSLAADNTDFVLQLKKVGPCEIGANAELMTVGPQGSAYADTLGEGDITVVQSSYRRLRVTLSSCERSEWLIIDVIVTGRADSRRVAASYRVGVFDILEITPVRAPKETKSMGDESRGPIEWLSPSVFVWKLGSESVVFEHVNENRFLVRRIIRGN